mmetsp:Transcript_32113/g.95824  ORF Transcript_32113/g.95824 Transcript_32113/m.95824 type:complete len:91 (-) Transcript_32113:12-284(-)
MTPRVMTPADAAAAAVMAVGGSEVVPHDGMSSRASQAAFAAASSIRMPRNEEVRAAVHREVPERGAMPTVKSAGALHTASNMGMSERLVA